MSFVTNLRQRVANIISPQKNSLGTNLARDFLRNGNRKPMTPDWTQIIMDDRDLYTGYAYAAIKQRANTVARVAGDYLRTDAKKEILEEANKKEESVTHPYLDILDTSRTFSNSQFWYQISSYLDLEGVYYLMAIRNSDGERVGNIQEFKMLNPYNVRRVLSKDQLEVTGYVENRGGMIREIPKELIIEIRDFNPFDENANFAMTDAAKEAQFTMKTAGDYTRHALRNNINAPGILTTDVILPPADFENFKARVTNHTKGEPLFGNGAGAIKWDSMNIELSKASLDRINEINRDSLFAAAGVSKTILGIEQSGTTRETARVQKDLNMENQILPRIQLIIDALNQDYKNYYPVEYDKTNYIIVVDNPLATDHESDIKEAEASSKRLDIYTQLINKGFDDQLAAKYASGEIELSDLGEPANEPVVPVVPGKPEDEADDKTDENSACGHDHDLPSTINNQLNENQQGLVQQQQGALRNIVLGVETRLTAAVIDRIGRRKNAIEYEDESDIVYKKDKREAIQELEAMLAAFYSVILPIFGKQVLNRRIKETGKMAFYKLNKSSRTYIADIARKVSEQHVETVLTDMLVAAREMALEGEGIDGIQRAIRKKFSEVVSKTRAETIARTETNRAFTRAQFEADKQFIEQNDLEGKVFKKWVVRSDNPCPFCNALAAEPAIPFEQNFRDLGDVLTVTEGEGAETKVSKLPINFEALEAGNAHANCSCAYQLIIE